jgi:hypothetical protein
MTKTKLPSSQMKAFFEATRYCGHWCKPTCSRQEMTVGTPTLPGPQGNLISEIYEASPRGRFAQLRIRMPARHPLPRQYRYPTTTLPLLRHYNSATPPLLHHYSTTTSPPLDHYFTTTGCPAWIKPRTFEANRAFSEGVSKGESKADQNSAPSCRAGDRAYRHQFAPFASTAMDANY